MTNRSPPDSSNKEINAPRDVAAGVTWAVSMRWVIRFIGLFSTLILARVLSPDDFGVASMGMIVVHFLFELSEMGTAAHLIRVKEISRAQCDTAWTITLLQGLLNALTLFALAGPASIYFKEPRVVEVMYVLAITSLIGGFENIGPVLLRRELKFAMDFRFAVYKKILVFVTTVSSAIMLRNYWALVLGYLAGTTAGVILSYFLHPYRPRWSLAYAPEYLHFGMAIIPLRIGNTLRGMIPSFLVAGIGNTAALGSYRVANEFSTLFTQEIVTPMGRGLFPNYVRLAHHPEKLSVVYRKILGIVALLCIPVGVGVSAVADDLVLVLLGTQWGFAAELIPYLAISAVIFAVSQTMISEILVATGRERSAAVLAWARLAITAPILWLGLEIGGVTGIAKATIVATIACLPLIYNEARRAVRLPFLALIGALWRPTIGGLVMFHAVKALYSEDLDWAIARLALDIFNGMTVFSITIFALWSAAKRPEGAEQLTIELLRNFGRRIIQRLNRR